MPLKQQLVGRTQTEDDIISLQILSSGPESQLFPSLPSRHPLLGVYEVILRPVSALQAH